MSKSRRRKRPLEFRPGNKCGSDTNSSELNCNVIARGGQPRRGGAASGRAAVPNHRQPPRPVGWRQILLVANLLLARHWQAASSHLVSEDEDSVIISGQQGHLFRGRKLAAPDDELAGQAKQVVAFLGLRYASAPIKRLRFMPPTPFSYGPTKQVAEQRQAHDLRHFGPICMQRLPMEPRRDQIWPPPANEDESWRSQRRQLQSALMDRLLVPQVSAAWRPLVRQLTSARFVQSEDCLNLNIYTPIGALRHSSERPPHADGLPVLVLIHGHSFDFGSGSTLDGRQFAREQRSLVITLNYRLHILGPTGKAGASARTNLGLLDQVAALHWIQANVRSFGGAPGRVTLMGAKGGAQFVHLLMVSPLARGLFQRAVLEDGSALSPVVANSLPAGQSRQQVGGALQQAKLVAQLNDCPLGPAAAANDDEHATWQPVVECLRSRPAASLVRDLPLELIDSSRPASAASIPIAARWVPAIEQVLELLAKEELKARLDQEERNKSSSGQEERQLDSRRSQLEELKQVLASATSSSEHSNGGVALGGQQLDRLIGLMVHRFLQEPADMNPKTNDEGGHKLRSLLAEILGAIYLPSNKTLPVGPPFAPQLDSGLILAGDHHHQTGPSGLELASSMLQPNSPFGQRDLLLGLSHTLINAKSNASEPGAKSAAGHHAAPGLSSRRLLELGLTEEQAIGQVNLFVGSFYRYHQQEISNSIVSQYLSRKTTSKAPATQAESHGSQQRQKQLFLAEAMRELYQDSLIDIPLIRTGLIHSVRQLETLAELFVSQQAVKLNEAQRNENRNQEELEQLVSERRIDEEFHEFVRGLYQDSNRWPIRLVPVSNATPRADASSWPPETIREKQSHSTFLFQMGANFDWLKSKLESALERKHSNPQVKTILSKLSQEIAGQSEPSEACSFEDLFKSDEFDDGELEPSPRGSLFKRFRLWICERRLGKRLASFVETGNVNRGSTILQEPKPTEIAFEHECANFLQESNHREDQLNDHHLVQLIHQKNRSDFEILVEKGGTPSGNLRCSRLLERMAFMELVEEGDQEDWSVFNVFGQQLASLFSAGSNDANWSQDSFLDPANNQLERERFDSKVTFWANFVSALNCSRTQPIGAGSLSLFAQANSTLLNMNLNLNCQQQQNGGATQQTANSLLQSVAGRIKQELSQQVVTWRRHRSQARGQPAVANLFSGPNHHSLRMANMSNGQLEQHQQQGGRMAQIEDGAAELVTEGANGLNFVAGWLAADNKWPNGSQGRLFVQHRLVWLSGAVLALVSILGVSALAVSRHRKRRAGASPMGETNALETARRGEPNESNGLQLDAGLLEEELGEKLAGSNGGLSEAPPCGVDLLYGQPYDGEHRQESPTEQSPKHLELFMSPAAFVEGQHAHLVHFAERNNFADAHMDAAGEHHHNHLPTCNLVLMGQHQALLSSSSETTSTTHNTHSHQRAPSSVSLVSSATPTNEGQPTRRAQKKRVQISEPKRCDEAASSFRGSQQQLGGVAASSSQFQLQELGEQQLNACPIHRSSSNLNLMLQAASLQNGTGSLVRAHEQHHSSHANHNHRHQQRALALHDQKSQQQVCAVHNFYQRPESNSGNYYAAHER